MKLATCTIHAPFDSRRVDWVADQEKVLAHDDRVSWFVSEDPYRKGVWWNYRQAAERLAETDATHVLGLQDDLLLCENFVSACYQLLELKPDRLVSLFYVSQKCAAESEKRDTGWHTDLDGLFGSIFLCPMAFLHDFLEWADVHTDPDCLHDDKRWALWSRYAPMSPREVWTPTQCLVEHLGKGKSVLKHHFSGTAAARFCKDAALVDWSWGIDRPYRFASRNELPWLLESYVP